MGLCGKELKRSDRHRISSLWLAAPVALGVALRGETRDTAAYVEIFHDTQGIPLHPLEYAETHGVEWGFGVLSGLVHSAGFGPRVLFFLLSLWTFRCIDRAARELGLNFYAVMPFYLGTFFLTQQLMQMRQGLAVALASTVVVDFSVRPASLVRKAFGAVVAFSIHIVSALPVVTAACLQRALPSPSRWRVIGWTLVLVLATALVAHLASSSHMLLSLERLGAYADDEEFAAARSALEFANVRAVMLLVLFVAAAPTARPTNQYLLLLGLYAIHVGIRFGFLNFAILSGRLSTVVGFVEIFLLPLAIRGSVRHRWARVAIAFAYLTVHAAATLTYQAPYLIDDYFTPLYTYYAPR